MSKLPKEKREKNSTVWVEWQSCSFFLFFFFALSTSLCRTFFTHPSPRCGVQSLANKIFYAGLICHIKSMSFAAATTQKAGSHRQRIINRGIPQKNLATPRQSRRPHQQHPSATLSPKNINKNQAPKVKQKIPKDTDTLTPALEFMRESNSPRGVHTKKLGYQSPPYFETKEGRIM